MKAPVHVIGAGFAGAAAATALAERGVPVTLWEARRTPGGRATSFPDPETGELLDNGPHLLLGCYRATRNLLARIGTESALAFQPRLSLPFETPWGHAELACPRLPGRLSLVAGMMGLGATSLGDRFSLLSTGQRLGDPVHPEDTVAAWLARGRATARARALLWDPLCRAIMNLEPDEAAAGPFVAALGEALLGPVEGARAGWAVPGLGALMGDALSGYLHARGGALRHGRVQSIAFGPADHRVAGLVVGGQTVPAASVVVATDPHQALHLVPMGERLTPLRSRLASMPPAAIVSVYLWLDRPVLPGTGPPLVGLIGGRAEWLFDWGRIHGDGPAGRRLAAVVSAADDLVDLPAGEIVRRVWAELSDRLPVMARARLLNQRVVKERHATVRLTPGLWRPAAGEIPGVPGLFLCGDYTDTGLPATIEGAALSGRMVADAAMAGG